MAYDDDLDLVRRSLVVYGSKLNDIAELYNLVREEHHKNFKDLEQIHDICTQIGRDVAKNGTLTEGLILNIVEGRRIRVSQSEFMDAKELFVEAFRSLGNAHESLFEGLPNKKNGFSNNLLFGYESRIGREEFKQKVSGAAHKIVEEIGGHVPGSVVEKVRGFIGKITGNQK